MSIQVNSTLVNYSSQTSCTKAFDKTKENEKNNIKSQMMDLKTSTSGLTRKEEIKTGYKTVNDYTKYLQNKYSFMNSGSTSMEGVPVTVNVSSAFLQKCKDNPDKAAYLEENLAEIPNGVKSLCDYVKCATGGGVVTYANYSIDANGNITCQSGSTNDPDGKIAKENAERKAKEQKAKKEKIEKKKAEVKEAEKRAEKAENVDSSTYNITVKGTDIKTVTKQIMSNFSSLSIGASKLTSVDVKV